MLFFQTIDWPFEFFCDQLCRDLFSCKWEVRHGAATALREFVKIHGPGAGKQANVSKTVVSCLFFLPHQTYSSQLNIYFCFSQMEDLHQQCLEDIALRLLCVLGLDRFGDFVTDQVTAPVRETCAQALGEFGNAKFYITFCP